MSLRSKMVLWATESVEVLEEAGKMRMDTYLSQEYPKYSRSQIGDLCERGMVTVNGVTKAKNYKVRVGDSISFEVVDKEQVKTEPQDIPLQVLYEDEHILAVNKVAGMCVHPGPGNPDGTFVNALLHHVGSDLAKGLMEGAEADCPMGTDIGQSRGRAGGSDSFDSVVDLPETPEASVATPATLRPGIVHRLDKGTSGILLAGKTTEAVAALSHLFAAREIEKIYLAVCVGHPGDITIVEPIGRDRRNRQLMTVYDEEDDGPVGKPAISHTKTFAFDGKLSAALVRIETGRTHQIRVHLKHRHTPIVGDEQYGNHGWNQRVLKKFGINRPLLHAYQLSFRHPFTREDVVLQAPVPEDMADMLGRMDAQASAVDEAGQAYPLVGSDGLLALSVEVSGQVPSERGFVPLDRLIVQDEDEFCADLPEEMAFWRE